MSLLIHLIAALEATSKIDIKLTCGMEKKTINTSNAYRAKWTVEHIKADVVFGSPKHRCKGVGICKVMMPSTLEDSKNIVAYISVSNDEQIKFDFLKTSLSEDMIKMHFRDRLFAVVDTFSFSDILLKKLNQESPLSILPGMYKVQESSRFLSVVF